MHTPSLPIQKNVSLSTLNTFGIAAIAETFLEITDITQLQALRLDARYGTMPRLILGGGSNVVLSDQVRQLVLKMALMGKQLIAEDDDFYYVQAQAGESWHTFVLWTLAHRYFGLENLSLIPGTVGAAPIQNIGAYGVEIKDFFHSLTWFDFESGEVGSMNKADCQFAYRDSIFKRDVKDRAVILSVTFALPKTWVPQLGYADIARYVEQHANGPVTATVVSDAIIAIRQSKLPDPAVIGNAGSFFKNPIVAASVYQRLHREFPALVSYPHGAEQYKLAAGWMIEQCGWKGRNLGHAGVYEKQALVLVNRGGATGQEVRILARTIQSDVQSKFGVALETEPVFC